MRYRLAVCLSNSLNGRVFHVQGFTGWRRHNRPLFPTFLPRPKECSFCPKESRFSERTYNVRTLPSGGTKCLTKHLIMNLVVNARDAMPDGGKLEITTKNVDVDASTAPAHPGAVPGKFALMTVNDNGIGMDETTLQSVFEPFFESFGCRIHACVGEYHSRERLQGGRETTGLALRALVGRDGASLAQKHCKAGTPVRPSRRRSSRSGIRTSARPRRDKWLIPNR